MLRRSRQDEKNENPIEVLFMFNFGIIVLILFGQAANAQSGTSENPLAFGVSNVKLSPGRVLVVSGSVSKGKKYAVDLRLAGGEHLVGEPLIFIAGDDGEVSAAFKTKSLDREGNQIHLQRQFVAPVSGKLFYREFVWDKARFVKEFPNAESLACAYEAKSLNKGGNKIPASNAKSDYELYLNAGEQTLEFLSVNLLTLD